MTQSPQGPIVQVKSQPNIYTVMLFVAILTLLLAVGVVLWRLMSDPPTGYGVAFGDLFKRLKDMAVK